MLVKLIDDKYYTDDKFNIFKKISTQNEKCHTHDFIEFVYIYKGKCIHKVDNEEYAMSKGDALLINYGSRHSYIPKNSVEYVDIIIKPEYINERLKGVFNAFALLSLNNFKEFSNAVDSGKKYIHFSTEEQSEIETLISLAESELKFKDDGSELISHSVINILLTMIFRKMSLKLGEKMTINNELLVYINENCGEPLTMEKISHMCFYNPSYFSRAFKSFAGMTFSQYLLKCRIKKACFLLLNEDCKIETVMDKCGFSNRTRFYECFRKETGQSPLDYRKSKK